MLQKGFWRKPKAFLQSRREIGTYYENIFTIFRKKPFQKRRK